MEFKEVKPHPNLWSRPTFGLVLPNTTMSTAKPLWGTVRPKLCSPQCLTAEEGHWCPKRPQLGAQGRPEEHCNDVGFIPVLLKAGFGPALRERDKNIHLTYLSLEWTRQISTLKVIAFKSSMDFENNTIAWYHKKSPIFISSWARLSFSPSSNSSIKAAKEMQLQWTGIHFP